MPKVSFYIKLKNEEDFKKLKKFVEEYLTNYSASVAKAEEEIEMFRKRGFNIFKWYHSIAKILMLPSALLTKVLTGFRTDPLKHFDEFSARFLSKNFLNLLAEAIKKWSVRIESDSKNMQYTIEHINHPIIYVNEKRPEFTPGVIALFMPRNELKRYWKEGLLKEGSYNLMVVDVLDREVKDIKKRLKKYGVKDVEVWRSGITVA